MQVPAFVPQPTAALQADGPALNPPKPLPVAKSRTTAGILLFLAAAIPAEGFWIESHWSLVAMVVTLALFLLAIGYFITGNLLGSLINAKNLMSLSRFQMAVWTIVVIASYASYAFVRMNSKAVLEALNIGIDAQLLSLMGISAASFLGTPFINGT